MGECPSSSLKKGSGGMISRKNGINCINNICDMTTKTGPFVSSARADDSWDLICLGGCDLRGRWMKLRMTPKKQTRW